VPGARPAPLVDAVLAEHGIEHGFGRRGSEAPEGCVFPRQVHGSRVARVAGSAAEPVEADAIVAARAGVCVGIVTADCVPILVASEEGGRVAAIHAGWRGFAAGVIEAGLRALRAEAGGRPLVAAIGPAARGCCYEVDAPVRDALTVRYPAQVAAVLVPGRAGHWQLDLPALATRLLEQPEWKIQRVGLEHRVCTICAGERFESYRRDGAAAGRLRHFIKRSDTIPRQG
jgi:YfiH family protein